MTEITDERAIRAALAIHVASGRNLGWSVSLERLGEIIAVEYAEPMAELKRLKKENTFLKSFLKIHSSNRNGQHAWKWTNAWPMDAVRGANVDEAVRHAIKVMDEDAK